MAGKVIPWITGFIHTLLRAESDSAARTVLGAQAQDDLLDAIAALSMVADRYIYGTGTDTVALGTITSFARTLLDDASGAAVWTTLGALSSQAAAGYEKLPSGTMFQWGANNGGSGGSNVSFPTTFPTACVAVVGSSSFGSGARIVNCSSKSTTGFHLDVKTVADGDSSVQALWIAVGY